MWSLCDCALYPQPPRCTVRPSECWDCCRNHFIQTGRNGLHHLDILLPTAGDEPQVRKTCLHHMSLSRCTSWPTLTICSEERCVLQSNSCCVDRDHFRTFQPVGICMAVSTHLTFRTLLRPSSRIVPIQVCENHSSRDLGSVFNVWQSNGQDLSLSTTDT